MIITPFAGRIAARYGARLSFFSSLGLSLAGLPRAGFVCPLVILAALTAPRSLGAAFDAAGWPVTVAAIVAAAALAALMKPAMAEAAGGFSKRTQGAILRTA